MKRYCIILKAITVDSFGSIPKGTLLSVELNLKSATPDNHYIIESPGFDDIAELIFPEQYNHLEDARLKFLPEAETEEEERLIKLLFS